MHNSSLIKFDKFLSPCLGFVVEQCCVFHGCIVSGCCESARSLISICSRATLAYISPCGSGGRWSNWGPHQIGLKKRVHWSRTDLGRDRQRYWEGESDRRGVQRERRGRDREIVGPWNMSLQPSTWFLCSASEPLIRNSASVLVKVTSVQLWFFIIVNISTSNEGSPTQGHTMTMVYIRPWSSKCPGGEIPLT